MKSLKFKIFLTKATSFFLLVGLCFLTSCGFQNERERGEELLLEIAEELDEIATLSELQEREMVLRNLWIELADVMTLLQKKEKEQLRGQIKGRGAIALERQMRRIYEIEGARDLIESSQREALIMLLKEEQKRQRG